MPETVNYSYLARRPMVATLRALIWIEEGAFSRLALFPMRMGVQCFGATRRQVARRDDEELRAAAR